MQGTFLGGAREVGRLGLVLGRGTNRLLLDYGLAPSDPPAYPKPAPPVSAALLTHAHLDHAGMMPAIAHEYDVPIYATGPTLDTAELLCRDCLKVHRLEGYSTPYQDFAISQLEKAGRPITWRSPFDLPGWEIQAENSGHIPGSSMFRLQAGRSILFTADLNTAETRLVEPAEPVGCDALVIEGTYSGREHEPREQIERAFLDTAKETLDIGGTVVVPAFAVGRTQEVLMVLDELDAPLHLDGMGRRVAELFLRHPSFLKDHGKLARAFENAHRIRGSRDRRRACRPGNVIVTTSGMIEGGPVLTYLSHMHDDPKSAILLTGYQVEGTNGRRLVEDGVVELDRGTVRVNARVEHFDFSGHAGHSELVRFAEGCSPDTIVLCHTDDPEPLVQDLETVADRVIAPSNGEIFELP